MARNFYLSSSGRVFAAVTLLAAQSAFAAGDKIAIQGWWSSADVSSPTIETIKLTNGVNYHTGITTSFTESGYAGGFKVYDATTNKTFEGWCVDIFHDFNFGNPSSTIDVKKSAASEFSPAKANDLGLLYQHFHTSIDSHSSSALNNAAFQLAVWEVVNEKAVNSYTLSSGVFSALGYGSGSTLTASNAAITQANNWLGQLNSWDQAGEKSKYVASVWEVQNNTSNRYGTPTWGAQDLVQFDPVPEPETYAMMLAGLGLMGALVRRRKAA